MAESLLTSFSDQLADAAAAISPSVVQVHGRRRPVSGTVHSTGVVVTTARALGRDDSARVRTPDGRMLAAETAGWDPATHLAVLRVDGLDARPAVASTSPARVGQLGLAVGRSWSNAATASMGIVAVIGGPLATGRGHEIAEVIRTTAPMHDGFAGGALGSASGQLLGIATGAAIRGLAVVIPAAIAWHAADDILEHGQRPRGFLGLSGQPVRLSARQRDAAGRESALLVVGVAPAGPAETSGVLVGDMLIEVDGGPIDSPEALLGALAGKTPGSVAALRLLRGGAMQDLPVTVGARTSP